METNEQVDRVIAAVLTTTLIKEKKEGRSAGVQHPNGVEVMETYRQVLKMLRQAEKKNPGEF
jgi:hypothetical protein